MPGDMRGHVSPQGHGNRWTDWRAPLRTLAIVLTLVAIAAVYLVRPAPRWFVTPSGVSSAKDMAEMSFFHDSIYVVRLGAHENAAYPIRLAVFYAGTGVPLRPREVREAIERAVETRTGASWTIVRENPVHHMLAPSVTVAYDLWADGGVRGDIVLRCPHQHGAPDAPVEVIEGVNSMRTGFSKVEHMMASIGEQLEDAAQLRCRESVAGLTADAPGIISSIATRVVSLDASTADSTRGQP